MTRLALLMAPNIPSDVNQAINITDCLIGKILYIYGVPNITAGIAMRWKEQIRAVTGQLAVAYELPDVIVNEPSLPFPNLGIKKQVVFLRDIDEDDSIRRKFQELVEVNKDMIPEPIEIYGEGTSKLSRMCYLMYIGDFIQAYLALRKSSQI